VLTRHQRNRFYMVRLGYHVDEAKVSPGPPAITIGHRTLPIRVRCPEWNVGGHEKVTIYLTHPTRSGKMRYEH
jgi:hypothetical protein